MMVNKSKVQGTRGVALGNRDEDLPPSRPDSPRGQPEPEAKPCPCGKYHPKPSEGTRIVGIVGSYDEDIENDDADFDDDFDFDDDDLEDEYVDDGSIYSPGTAAGLWVREALGSDAVLQEPLTFRERDYPDFEEICPECSLNTLDHTDFIMPCSPEALRQSRAQHSITPSGWMATAGPEGIVITAKGRDDYYVLCKTEKQNRAAYGQRWSWCCYRVGNGGDPCDEDYMRSIST